ncbi:hypothetical protein [Caulobacter hibisci]|uniref:Uncharacterized protein n=1 Tax=Caulobacter hibisci TaxID=2035993 RepID=A0ABS0SZ69_9CAUL|nr:hypothetical protein [Caulobacter hibisci]MBI1683953.1 hypothetical protein [Caulobacter hibisci]
MRRLLVTTLLAPPLLAMAGLASSLVPAAAGADEALFARREAGAHDARYGTAIARAYDALDAGRADQALKDLRAADRLPLHEAANYALLPQIAYLQARAGQVAQARETTKLARLAVALEDGSARCVDTDLQAQGYDAETRRDAAARYCNAFGGPKPDDLYRRKLAGVEARLR